MFIVEYAIHHLDDDFALQLHPHLHQSKDVILDVALYANMLSTNILLSRKCSSIKLPHLRCDPFHQVHPTDCIRREVKFWDGIAAFGCYQGIAEKVFNGKRWHTTHIAVNNDESLLEVMEVRCVPPPFVFQTFIEWVATIEGNVIDMPVFSHLTPIKESKKIITAHFIRQQQEESWPFIL